MNVYESQKIARILADEYELTDDLNVAELIILNTCSVRDKPEKKVYSYLGELAELRKNKPDLLIGVGGCVAQQVGKKLAQRYVNFVFGTHNLSLIPALIEEYKRTHKVAVALDWRDEWEDLPLGLGGVEGVSAFVAVSRGCNKHCAYCIVPSTRGREISRDPLEIKREVEILAKGGVKEVVLLGQTVNSYGLDIKMTFAELLDLVSEVDGVERIRFTSPHPTFMTSKLIEYMASNPKICHQFHIPLQSGNDRILKLMRRGYTQERFLEMAGEMRAAMPDVALTTDVIVGFPGESEEEFQDTLAVLKKVRFSLSYSFAYSDRPGTPSVEMEGHLSQEEKLSRLYRYIEVQEKITEEYLQSWVGKECEILLEGPSAENPELLYGRNSQNVVVNLQKSDNSLKIGQLLTVKIEKASKHTLKGSVLSC